MRAVGAEIIGRTLHVGQNLRVPLISWNCSQKSDANLPYLLDLRAHVLPTPKCFVVPAYGALMLQVTASDTSAVGRHHRAHATLRTHFRA